MCVARCEGVGGAGFPQRTCTIATEAVSRTIFFAGTIEVTDGITVERGVLLPGTGQIANNNGTDTTEPSFMGVDLLYGTAAAAMR